ncbi:hypothetical protein DNF11_1749 [Malassezia restricta CBS 7877]|uniref:MICOS complex subunit mic19 n=2 Tax=Malassezia restricta TaxID=76775 RepID=A0A3G2S5R3_MALR7|nr:hypothetical protein DNF11_1749 [Malassezia restricta CBS 7877]
MGFFSSFQSASKAPGESIDTVEVGRTLLNKLEEAKPDLAAPAPEASRQSVLDENVQKKLKEELAELRKQEKDVQKQIALALEKENLERESSSWLSKDKGQSSQLLQQELDRVKTQIEKYNRRDMASFPEVVKARQAVVQCYRDHAGRTLDCWKEVEQFKNAFAEAEKELMAAWK